jgi:small GTP-binding protein
MSRSLKVVIVGDGAVGKTCLLTVYRTNDFPTEYIPTVYDNETREVYLDGIPYDLQIWDTAGQEELDTIRTLCYPGTDLFLVCFSADSPVSLANVQNQWMPELNRHITPDELKVVLIATKIDLRSTTTPSVSKNEGLKVAREIDALKYFETAAKWKQGVQELFGEAIKLAIHGGGGGCCSVQ